MKRFRFTIRALVFAVVVVAVDCVVFSAITSEPTVGALVAAGFGALPMGNVVAIVAYLGMVRGSANRPFRVGFAVFGAIAVLVWFNGCLAVDDATREAAKSLMLIFLERVPFAVGPIGQRLIAEHRLLMGVYFAVVITGLFVALTGLPQLLFALAGGWLSARLAMVLRRGGRSVEDSSACVVQGDPGGDA